MESEAHGVKDAKRRAAPVPVSKASHTGFVDLGVGGLKGRRRPEAGQASLALSQNGTPVRPSALHSPPHKPSSK